VIPPEHDPEFVYRMERVLDLYHEPYDPDRPVVCFDESHKLLRDHKVDPLPAQPGAVERVDHHYDRNGRRELFMMSEPLAGWRHVEIFESRDTEDWIESMCQIADEHHPDADCIRVVLDNLSTHKPEAFYELFPPDEARQYLDRFEFYFTPVHGSWLNMAEVEWSALGTECLDRRIPDEETLRDEITAWENQRNNRDTSVDWQFTTDDARIKLDQLYPVSENS